MQIMQDLSMFGGQLEFRTWRKVKTPVRNIFKQVSSEYLLVVFQKKKNQRLATITFIYLQSCFHNPCGPQSIQLPNCLKIAETSVVLNVFKGTSSVTSALTLLPFLSVAQQESSTRKAIFWSVTVSSNNKTLNARLLARVITGCHCT